MRALKLVLGTLVLTVSAALAVTYTVDPEGGPGDLVERVAQAFAGWLELDDTLVADVEEDAPNVFSYGDTRMFGDDTYSLTVQRQSPERRVHVIVNPALAQPNDANALLHEAGLLLGLSTADTGVMNPALPNEPLVLGEAEIGALSTAQTSVPEDINQDGEVNFYDLVEFSRTFGQPGVTLPADINEDGQVDRDDLELLREAYTFNPPSSEPPSEEELSDDELGDFFEDEFEPDLEETGGLETGGIETGGSETGGTETGGVETGGAETGGTGTGGLESETGGTPGGEPEGDDSEGDDAETGGAETDGTETGGN